MLSGRQLKTFFSITICVFSMYDAVALVAKQANYDLNCLIIIVWCVLNYGRYPYYYLHLCLSIYPSNMNLSVL